MNMREQYIKSFAHVVVDSKEQSVLPKSALVGFESTHSAVELQNMVSIDYWYKKISS